MQFEFSQDMYGISTVDLQVCIDEKKKLVIPMLYNNGKWECSIDSVTDNMKYRFSINSGCIELNDPCAYSYIADKNNKVWSVKKMEGNKNDLPIKLVRNGVTDRVMNDIDKMIVNKNLKLHYNREVAIGLKLEPIIGVHAITVIWYQPDGRVYHVDERTLISEKEVEAEVWFWLELKEMSPKFCIGAWTLEVYLDGYKTIKDNFVITETIKEQYIGFSCTA